MQVSGEITVKFFARPGDTLDLDDMNRTTMVVNGQVYGPRSFTMPSVSMGDAVQIRVPSGTLTLQVSAYEGYPIGDERYRATFDWSGQYAGFATGQSGIATWWNTPEQCGHVETSAWHEPIPYRIYHRARLMLRDLPVTGREGGRIMLEQAIRLAFEQDVLLEQCRQRYLDEALSRWSE